MSPNASLTPATALQRSLQARLVQAANDLLQSRMLLFVGANDPIPVPFLAILVFWLVIIFMSFSLFSELNVTVFALLVLFAVSAACALYLILELSRPFAGLMMISSEPLRQAFRPLP